MSWKTGTLSSIIFAQTAIVQEGEILFPLMEEQ
jgi:hypothetical protein